MILRHCYGLSRQDAARLPLWERSLLVVNGRALLGLDDADDRVGGELGLSGRELAFIAGD